MLVAEINEQRRRTGIPSPHSLRLIGARLVHLPLPPNFSGLTRLGSAVLSGCVYLTWTLGSRLRVAQSCCYQGLGYGVVVVQRYVQSQ